MCLCRGKPQPWEADSHLNRACYGLRRRFEEKTTVSLLKLTPQPQEVVDGAQELHGHVVVDQGVLQHARLETQVAHVLPHPTLAALLIVPEEGEEEEEEGLVTCTLTHTSTLTRMGGDLAPRLIVMTWY